MELLSPADVPAGAFGPIIAKPAGHYKRAARRGRAYIRKGPAPRMMPAEFTSAGQMEINKAGRFCASGLVLGKKREE